MKVRLGPHAVDDLKVARDYYAAVSAEVSTDFRHSFEQLIGRLCMFPRGAPPVEGFPGVRRARLTKFRYGVFYRFSEQDELEILRVIHSARDTRDLEL